MSFISKPEFISKGAAAVFSLLEEQLLLHPLVSSDPYFSVSSNWKKVVLFYNSTEGGQKATVSFETAQSLLTAQFFVSTQARDVFNISGAYILDFDGGKIVIPRDSLDTELFDIVLIPNGPFLLNQDGSILLTELGEEIELNIS